MAFGDVYGYRTNSRFVAAVAESDERTRVIGEEPNPNYDPEGPADETNPETVDVEETVVDLVLLGFANGRRNNTIVVAAEDAKTNQAVPAGADLNDLISPGETTARATIPGPGMAVSGDDNPDTGGGIA